jgi:hypothetical protein
VIGRFDFLNFSVAGAVSNKAREFRVQRSRG